MPISKGKYYFCFDPENSLEEEMTEIPIIALLCPLSNSANLFLRI